MTDRSNILHLSDATKRQPSPSSATSDTQRQLTEAEAKLLPAEPTVIVAELAACLTLVGAGSMSQGDRTEWIKVAKQSIGDIPASAFQEACAEARRKCRFANELVPAIIDAAERPTRWLRDSVKHLRYRLDNPPVALLTAPPEDQPLTVEEVLNMKPTLVEMGRKGGWIDADVLVEVDRIIDERQAEANREWQQ